MSGVKTHRDLEVFKQSVDFVTLVYTFTKNFPQEEMYGLVSQMRRAAVSIPSNIAEGSARKSLKEYIHFIYISLGSVFEIETQILISVNLGFIEQSDSNVYIEKLTSIKRMLIALINSLSKL